MRRRRKRDIHQRILRQNQDMKRYRKQKSQLVASPVNEERVTLMIRPGSYKEARRAPDGVIVRLRTVLEDTENGISIEFISFFY